jgi:hypothetical protein
MRLHYPKRYGIKIKSEGGFVLVAALMAIMILMAVGFFALTVTSQDIRISAMLVGERKAFSAAEAGVHEVCRLLNPFNPVAIPWTKFDNTNDPSVEYSAGSPEQNGAIPSIPLPGYDLSKAYVGSVFESTVSGRDTSYTPDVMTQITVGTVYAPNPSDTQQGQN